MNLTRDTETGSFKDTDLAAILMNAIEDPAGAFKARGIPEVMRIVEIMGIEQARQWGTCTVSETFIRTAHARFSFWSIDERVPKIHGLKALWDLRGLELRS